MDTYKVRLDGCDLKGVKVRLSPSRAKKGAIWKLHDMLTSVTQGNHIKVDRVKVIDVCTEQAMIVVIKA